MLDLYYGLIPKQTSVTPTVNVYAQSVSDPGINGPYTVYFHLTLKSQSGYNLTSTGVKAEILSGQKSRIEILIPSTVVPNSNLDIKKVVLSVSSNGVSNNSLILKEYNISDLPYVEIFFNTSELVPSNVSAYVESVYFGNGYLQPLSRLDPNKAAIINYSANGVSSDPIKFTLLNGEQEDGSAPILGGSLLTLRTYLDTVISDILFSNKLEYILYGYYRFSDGSITTNNIFNAGVWYSWNASDPLIVLNQSIPPGYGAYVGVRLRFNLEEIPEIGYKSILQIIPRIEPPRGEFNALGKAFGDLILPFSNKIKIIPQKNGLIKSLDGFALVNDKVTPYVTSKVHVIPDIAQKTNQYIWLDSNGNTGLARNLSSLPTDSVVRAIFNTQSGESNLINWTPFITTNNSPIIISGTLTDLIRSSYEDSFLAGTTYPSEIYFNATQLNIYIQENSTSGTLRKVTQNLIPITISGNYNYTYQLSNFTGSLISGIPDQDFGLFTPTIDSYGLISGVSVSLSGAYRIGTTLSWDGSTVSYISHDPKLGCINTLDYEFSVIANNGSYWLQPSENLTIDQLHTYVDLKDSSIRYDKTTGYLWFWNTEYDPSEIDAIYPSGIASTAHWSKLKFPTSEVDVATKVRVILNSSNLEDVLDIVEEKLKLSNIVVKQPFELRNFSSDLLADGAICIVKNYHLMGYFDSESYNHDNGYNIFRPFNLNINQPGRWNLLTN